MSQNVPGDEPIGSSEPQQAQPVVPSAPVYAPPPPGTPTSYPGASGAAPQIAGGPVYAPPVYGAPVYGAPAYARAPQQPQGLAVSSMVLGISSAVLAFVPPLFWITLPASIVGLVLGIVALNRRQSGGMAVTGIILCALVCLFYVFVLVLLMLGFGVLFWAFDEMSRYYG